MYGTKQKTEEEGYVADNGWFDGETLSAEEQNREALLVSYRECETLRKAFEKNARSGTETNRALYLDVQAFHRKKNVGFLSQVQVIKKEFRWETKGNPNYASAKRAFKAAKFNNLSMEELTGLLWRRFRLGASRERALAQGGYSSYLEIFPDYYAEWANRTISNEKKRNQLKTIYLQMLAVSIGGLVKEYQAFYFLKQLFGDLVQWGTPKQDTQDIDLWIGDYAISVKTGSTFSIEEFEKHRQLGFTDPVAYICPVLNKEDGSVSYLRVCLPPNEERGYKFTNHYVLKQFARSTNSSSQKTSSTTNKAPSLDKTFLDAVSSDLNSFADEILSSSVDI